MTQVIISGGQTGADRGGIDAAIQCGVEYGGWLPKGRKAEDGTVPARYKAMKEMTRGGYPKRTEANVVDSDGTVVFSRGALSGGSALTRRLCRQHAKPFLYIDLDSEADPVSMAATWIEENGISVLNVAGSRESKHQGIHDRVVGVVSMVVRMINAEDKD